MKTEKILNKERQEYITTDGKPLLKKTLEVGDEFIPIKNTLIAKENKSENKTIKNYKVIAKVRDSEGNIIKNPEEDEDVHFIDLTPSQANTIQKRLDAEIEINQYVWVVYNYESKEHGTQIGVGMKKTHQKPIDFPEK